MVGSAKRADGYPATVSLPHPDFDPAFLARSVEVAAAGASAGRGGPFGALVVRDGQVIAETSNRVLADTDPTAHAEVSVIRLACRELDSFQLDGCQLYSSCEPCPMCLGAVYWARPDVLFYAATRQDAAFGSFDDEFIYTELTLPQQARRIPFLQVDIPGAREVFIEWNDKTDRTPY